MQRRDLFSFKQFVNFRVNQISIFKLKSQIKNHETQIPAYKLPCFSFCKN